MVTLYLSHDNGMLGKKAQSLFYCPARGAAAESVPIHLVDDVVVLGRGSVSTPALHLLMDENVPVHFIDGSGQYKGSLTSGRGRGYAIRRLQFEAAFDGKRALEIGRYIVAGKLMNQRKTLLRVRNRRLKGDIAIAEVCENLSFLAVQALDCMNIDELRGLEGIGAAAYFSVFGKTLLAPWTFRTRTRRPPKDPVNALLSFGYTLLLSHVVSAVSIAGLDPCVGFLHPEYRGRPALALDLMEEFRSPVVDRLIIGILNQAIMNTAHFSHTECGGIHMSKEAKGIFLRQYRKRLDTSVRNELTEQTATFRTHIALQAGAFLSALREGTAYRPILVDVS